MKYSTIPAQWPENIIQVVPLIEVKETRAFNHIIKSKHFFEKYSSIDKATRVMAYVLRFKPKQRGHLTINEIKKALMVILKLVQRDHFQEEIKQLSQNKDMQGKSNLRALNPFLNDDGIIRVGGRLRNFLLPYNEKHQIVLPKKQSHHKFNNLKATHFKALRRRTGDT